MLNSTYQIKSFTSAQAKLSWTTANSTDISYVFVNGTKVAGAMRFSTTARTILIPVLQSRAFVVEIHDFTTPQDNIIPITVPSNKLPMLEWDAVDEAEYYKIYVENRFIQSLKKQNNLKNFKKQILSSEFDGRIGKWYFFTVTSVDGFGNESLLKYFPHYIYDVPKLVNSLVVSQGSMAGKYNFTIGI